MKVLKQLSRKEVEEKVGRLSLSPYLYFKLEGEKRFLSIKESVAERAIVSFVSNAVLEIEECVESDFNGGDGVLDKQKQ